MLQPIHRVSTLSLQLLHDLVQMSTQLHGEYRTTRMLTITGYASEARLVYVFAAHPGAAREGGREKSSSSTCLAPRWSVAIAP
jgi:hypothetical protein